MDFLVPAQTCKRTERPITNVAFKVHVIYMNFLMNFEVFPTCELLVTRCAFVFMSFGFWDFLVGAAAVDGGRAICASVDYILWIVNAHMFNEVWPKANGLTTNLTFEWFAFGDVFFVVFEVFQDHGAQITA